MQHREEPDDPQKEEKNVNVSFSDTSPLVMKNLTDHDQLSPDMIYESEERRLVINDPISGPAQHQNVIRFESTANFPGRVEENRTKAPSVTVNLETRKDTLKDKPEEEEEEEDEKGARPEIRAAGANDDGIEPESDDDSEVRSKKSRSSKQSYTRSRADSMERSVNYYDRSPDYYGRRSSDHSGRRSSRSESGSERSEGSSDEGQEVKDEEGDVKPPEDDEKNNDVENEQEQEQEAQAGHGQGNEDVEVNVKSSFKIETAKGNKNKKRLGTSKQEAKYAKVTPY